MRRLLTLSIASAMLAFGATGSGLAQVPPGDSVGGDARDCVRVLPGGGFCEVRTLRIDAHSGPNGENPTGTVDYGFSLDTPSTAAGGEGAVTCLSVAGNVAVVGFTGREFSFLFPFVAGFAVVADGGGPDSDLDRFRYVLEYDFDQPLPGPTDCAAPAGALSWANDEGDLTVTDAQPPATYTQCRQGGWITYGFSSHAACISYVHDFSRAKCIFERAFIGIGPFREKYGRGPNHDYAMSRCVRRYTGF
jgi:hypothetical protein